MSETEDNRDTRPTEMTFPKNHKKFIEEHKNETEGNSKPHAFEKIKSNVYTDPTTESQTEWNTKSMKIRVSETQTIKANYSDLTGGRAKNLSENELGRTTVKINEDY